MNISEQLNNNSHKNSNLLLADNNLLRQLTESITDIFFAFDKKLKYTYWNKASEILTGIPAKDAIGKSLFELFPRTPATEKAEELYKQVLETGQPASIINLNTINNNEYAFEISAFPIKSGLSVFVKDVTEHKKAEIEILKAKEKAEESEKQLLLIANNMPILISRISSDEIYLFANSAYEKFFGKELHKIIGKSVKEIIGEDAYLRAKHHIQEVLTGKTVTYENDLTLINNQKATFLTTYVPEIIRDKIVGYFLIAIDITERKRVEEEVEQSFQRFRSLIDVAPFGAHVYELHPDNQLIFIGTNKAANNILHINNERFIGMPIEDAFPNLTSTDIPELYREVAKNGKPFNREEITYSDNQGIAGAFELWGFQTAPNKMAVFFRDITEKKKAEEALRISQALYSDLVETAQDLIWQCDSEGRYTYLNPAWEDLFGYKVEEMLGKKFSDFQLSEWAKRDEEQFKKLLDGKVIKGLETEHLGKDKKEINLVFNAKAIIDIHGNPLGVRGTAYNITERKHFETELIKAKETAENNEERLKEAQALTHIGHWELDLKNNKLLWSDEIYRIFGCEPQEFGATYESFLNFVHPEDRELVNNTYNEHLNSKKPYDIVHRIQLQNGTVKFVNERCKTKYDFNNKPLISVGTVADITNQTILTNQLIAAKEKAEESDKLKTAFLQNMSHEIRTPLNAILGFSALLAPNFNKKEKLIYFSEIIVKKGNDLLDLIDSVLNISKIESGQISLNIETFNLNSYLQELEVFYSEYKNRINKGNVDFKVCNSAKELNLTIILDLSKLKQILTNLIGNAFKFTHNGSIEVCCSVKDNCNLIFSVSDTGIGIPKNKQEEIFMRFRQASHETALTYGGTGLGLSIVKGLLNILKGEIWIESEPGKGSTFNFSVPFQNADNNIQKL